MLMPPPESFRRIASSRTAGADNAHWALRVLLYAYVCISYARADGRGRGRGTERNGGHRSREAGYKHLPITRAHHYLPRRVVHVLAGALSFFNGGACGNLSSKLPPRTFYDSGAR